MERMIKGEIYIYSGRSFFDQDGILHNELIHHEYGINSSVYYERVPTVDIKLNEVVTVWSSEPLKS